MSPAPAGGAMADARPRSASDAALRLVLLAVYMALIGYAGVHHAMWRDEAQAWLIARDAGGIAGLFDNLRYEGHPALWHLILFGFTRVSDDPNLMLALNFVLMSVAVALVLWCLPLRTWERILFPFGTYMLFEYAVKARSYGLGTLLVVLLCLAWPRRADRPVLLALLMALLANTHALFFLVTLAAAAGLALERLLGRPTAVPLKWPTAAAVLILGAGWLLALATFIPPADTGIAATWNFGLSPERLEMTIATLGAFLGAAGDGGLAPLVGLVLAGTLVAIRRAVAPATFLVLATGGLAAFIYTKFGGSAWTSGVFFLVFLAAVWMARSAGEGQMTRLDRGLLSACLTVTLAFQAWFGIAAYRAELSRPYSSARAVAGFLAAKGWTGDPIAGMSDQRMAAIIAYTGADRFYFLNGERWGSFTIWDQRRLAPVDGDAALGRLETAGSATVVVDAMTLIDPALPARHGFHEAARFTGAARPDEDFIVYRREAAPP